MSIKEEQFVSESNKNELCKGAEKFDDNKRLKILTKEGMKIDVVATIKAK